jgi:hypothetical protein
MLTFGTDTNELWENALKDVHHRTFVKIILINFYNILYYFFQ